MYFGKPEKIRTNSINQYNINVNQSNIHKSLDKEKEDSNASKTKISLDSSCNLEVYQEDFNVKPNNTRNVNKSNKNLVKINEEDVKIIKSVTKIPKCKKIENRTMIKTIDINKKNHVQNTMSIIQNEYNGVRIPINSNMNRLDFSNFANKKSNGNVKENQNVISNSIINNKTNIIQKKSNNRDRILSYDNQNQNVKMNKIFNIECSNETESDNFIFEIDKQESQHILNNENIPLYKKNSINLKSNLLIKKSEQDLFDINTSIENLKAVEPVDSAIKYKNMKLKFDKGSFKLKNRLNINNIIPNCSNVVKKLQIEINNTEQSDVNNEKSNLNLNRKKDSFFDDNLIIKESNSSNIFDEDYFETLHSLNAENHYYKNLEIDNIDFNDLSSILKSLNNDLKFSFIVSIFY